MQVLGQALSDIAGLVDLAALDRRVTAECLADGLGKRFRSVDDEQPADRRIETAFNQVICIS